MCKLTKYCLSIFINFNLKLSPHLGKTLQVNCVLSWHQKSLSEWSFRITPNKECIQSNLGVSTLAGKVQSIQNILWCPLHRETDKQQHQQNNQPGRDSFILLILRCLVRVYLLKHTCVVEKWFCWEDCIYAYSHFWDNFVKSSESSL